MRGLVIKSLVLTILLVAGLYSIKYFLKSSLYTVFNLPPQTESIGFSYTSSLADTTIILVNIGQLNRKDIAEAVRVISAGDPSVIAFNICFDRNRKTPYDSLLFDSFGKGKNIVLGSSDEKCHFTNKAYYGKEEFYIHEDGVVRSFPTDSAAISSVIVRLYDSRLYENLKHRKKKEELINYIGNYTHFLTLDAKLVNYDHFPREIFKNKIVLLGKLGDPASALTTDLGETYETPVTHPQGSRMYRTEITANILHTIIEGKYITIVPALERSGLYLLLLIFNSAMGFIALKKSRKLFALTLTILVIGESCMAAFFMIILSSENIILNMEELPFIVLGGFLIQFYLLKCRFYLLSDRRKNQTF